MVLVAGGDGTSPISSDVSEMPVGLGLKPARELMDDERVERVVVAVAGVTGLVVFRDVMFGTFHVLESGS